MHACIDLGSNSFHLLIGEWEEGGIHIIERLSEKVQLGERVGSSGRISPEAFERGIACLRRFRLLMKQYPVEKYWALGTNTFRIAANADEFIKAARELGIHVSTISGVQEALLIYAGVVTALPVSDSHRLIVDVGGGSTEIIVGRGHQRLLTESLPVGSVAWRDRFFSESPRASLEAGMDAGTEAARSLFRAVEPGLQRVGWSETWASSGTVKMLAGICQEHGYGKGQIRLRGLYELKSMLVEAIATGGEIAGLKERRRDMLLPGWCVLVALMESYRLETIDFSATALREGMFNFMVNNAGTFHATASSGLPEVRYAHR